MWLLTIVPQSAWLVLSHDLGTASRQLAPTHWFLSMPLSTFSFNLKANGSNPPHIPDQSAYCVPKCLQPTTTSLRLTNKSREKATARPHLPATLSPCSIWPVQFSQFFLPGRQSASFSSFLACWKPKTLVSFPASFSTLQITVVKVKRQLVWRGYCNIHFGVRLERQVSRVSGMTSEPASSPSVKITRLSALRQLLLDFNCSSALDQSH